MSRWPDYDIRRKQALDMLRSGKFTQLEVAEIVGVGHASITRWAAAAGLGPGRGHRARHPIEEIIRAVRVHGSQGAAARALGITQQTISLRLQRLDHG